MSTEDILFNIIGWPILLWGAFWYSNRKRHPSRSPIEAFTMFCGIFGGITLGGLFAVVATLYGLGLEERKVPGTIGGMFAFAVLFPAWNLAVKKISQAKHYPAG